MQKRRKLGRIAFEWQAIEQRTGRATLSSCFCIPMLALSRRFRASGCFLRQLAALALLGTLVLSAGSARGQRIRLPTAKGEVAEIYSTGPQKKQGDLWIADDNVDIHYGDSRLQADHVEYNEKTSEAVSRGHVFYDYLNEHLEATEAHYNVSTGRGTLREVRGT